MIKSAAYQHGFVNRCLERGVNPEALVKQAQSVKERYPRSLESIRDLRQQYPTDAGSIRRMKLAPEEYSISNLVDEPYDIDARYALSSIDELPYLARYEALRDPRFMTESGRMTPAGTNLVNDVYSYTYNGKSVPSDFWNYVDSVTGAGQGPGRRDIKLPEGFLYDTAPTNSELSVSAPVKKNPLNLRPIPKPGESRGR